MLGFRLLLNVVEIVDDVETVSYLRRVMMEMEGCGKGAGRVDDDSIVYVT